ncbi:MAG: hypothetical protein AB7K68_09005 [Bacteriovoracia bacterium]
MRPLFILALSLFVASSAHAGMGAMRCYQKLGTLDVLMSQDDALKLCEGAKSDAPAACFEHVLKNVDSIVIDDAVSLCRGATSKEPAECLVSLLKTNGPTAGETGIRLCR